MKRRVISDLLKQQQRHTLTSPNPQLHQLNSLSYNLITEMIADIKRPFRNICIHGRQPELILPHLLTHNSKFNLPPKDTNITLVDYIRNEPSESLLHNPLLPIREIRYIQNPDMWLPEEDQYDLLLTSMEMHHCNSEEDLLRKYIRTLQPDGALVGCTLAEGTLTELHWAYSMAENERHGGNSPKVMHFSGLGDVGSFMTAAKFQLVTILAHEQTLEFQSFVDLLVLLQQIGQSGYLRGRRKGVFKDLLLAAGALYTSQFQTAEGKIKSTLALGKFIGWKYHESQPRKLTPGKQVNSVQFVDQLRKFGQQVENYLIQEGVDDPKKVK